MMPTRGSRSPGVDGDPAAGFQPPQQIGVVFARRQLVLNELHLPDPALGADGQRGQGQKGDQGGERPCTL
mgnify:CR=1 FL=1